MKRCCCGSLAKPSQSGKLCTRCGRAAQVTGAPIPYETFEILESEKQLPLFTDPAQPRAHSQGIAKGKKK